MHTLNGDSTVESVRSPQSFRPKSLKVIGVAAIALLAASCAENAPQDTWAPKGPNAQRIHDLQWPVFLIAGIVGVIVFAVVGYCVVRFRDRGQPIPEQSHGNQKLEIILTIIPAVILAVISVPTVTTLQALNNTDDTECVINVTGQQWWWEVDYPVQDGCGGIPAPIVTSGQMVVPIGTKILVRGTSRDVIHSWWIPPLNGKRDMVPGRTHTVRLEADEPGIYAGQCTEFCGLSHANMRMEVISLTQDDFNAWRDNQLAAYESPEEGTLAAAGESTFITQCSRCHQVDGLTDGDGELVISRPDLQVYSGVAPNLTNFATRNTFAGASWDLLTDECRADVWGASPADVGDRYLAGVGEACLNEAELREWLRNAPAKKPMYADPEQLEETDNLYRGMPNLGLSEDQIDELIAYLLERK